MTTFEPISRRAAIKAAATFAIPMFLPTVGWARTRRAAPSERITLGVIGVGNMGGAHLGGLLGNSELQLVAICDVDEKKRGAAKERVEKHYAAERDAGTYKGCETYREYESVLARPDIDAVLIAVPDHWHAIIAVDACRAGKDVYCEKPLALTVRDADAMVAAARRYGRVFQTGSQQRSSSEFRRACELVRGGFIGKLTQVNVGVGGPSQEAYLPEEPVREGFDWERWLGPAPVQPYNGERCSGRYEAGWRNIRDYSGGMMTDWGAHHFDIAQWGMGMDGKGPVEIIPPAKPPAVRETPDPAKGQTLTFKYANGVTMIHGGANGVLFTGTDGKVEVNRGYIKTWPDKVEKEPIRPDRALLIKSDNHVQNWVDCIRSRQRPIADVAIGASTITVCHLGNIAYWTGRTIRWDPEQRVILGDDAAARLLDRPKRSPYTLRI